MIKNCSAFQEFVFPSVGDEMSSDNLARRYDARCCSKCGETLGFVPRLRQEAVRRQVHVGQVVVPNDLASRINPPRRGNHRSREVYARERGSGHQESVKRSRGVDIQSDNLSQGINIVWLRDCGSRNIETRELPL